MLISGTDIARGIIAGLAAKTSAMADSSKPRIHVISVGENPASQSYIRQKAKAAEAIGAQLTHDRLPEWVTDADLSGRIALLNADPKIHGIIVQRPLPETSQIRKETLLSISPEKDVDGFTPGSAFAVPVADAVLEILMRIYELERAKSIFSEWLKTQTVAVIGKGETAGAPIARMFTKLECATSIVDSSTPDPAKITGSSRIIVSCVGRAGVVRSDMVMKGAILISVGLTRTEEGKLVGDYDEADIASKAGYYTPTPGGVGPVNVACLMKNLVTAASGVR